MSRCKIAFSFIVFWVWQSAYALGNDQLLPADEAFKLTAHATSPTQIVLTWEIHDGYYLYRDKLKFVSQLEDIVLGEPLLPDGKRKQDEFFGTVETYRHQLRVTLPLTQTRPTPEFSLQVTYQGCADIGVCYPPQKKLLSIVFPDTNASAATEFDGFLASLGSSNTQSLVAGDLLPAEQAFRFFATVKDEQTLSLSWTIADGYYLYRDKIKLTLENDAGTTLADYTIPRGQPYHDEAFGDVEIFYQDLSFDVPLIRTQSTAHPLTLTAQFQGCADRGVCYPPMQASEELILAKTVLTTDASMNLSQQDQIISSLHQNTLWLTLLSFFGFGLLLAFTPCVFPMIPILSGIIVGQNQTVTTRKAFLLSFSYVIASALTYTVFGILAALFGSNLQASFQEPWVIVLFSALFVLLSLSMFGFYNLEIPKSLQNLLHQSSNQHRDGSYLGAFIMGALSSLIVGPCVAAPLAAALAYIGQTGDVVLGGSALFSMGLGMGAPLLLLGTSAGKLLPKAGRWMNATKAVFGVLMLAVAVWMLDRILPAAVTMVLWAMLFIIPAIYLSAIDPLPADASNWKKLWKGFGMIFLVYGIMLLIGSGTGNHNPLQPLQGLAAAPRSTEAASLPFQRIKTVEDLDRHIRSASAKQQTVMLDFYADWCISCKEMEAYTFTDPEVRSRLADFVLLQADVTANDEEDRTLLRRFNLIGPPGILFFGADEQEIAHARVIGFQSASEFNRTLQSL